MNYRLWMRTPFIRLTLTKGHQIMKTLNHIHPIRRECELWTISMFKSTRGLLGFSITDLDSLIHLTTVELHTWMNYNSKKKKSRANSQCSFDFGPWVSDKSKLRITYICSNTTTLQLYTKVSFTMFKVQSPFLQKLLKHTMIGWPMRLLSTVDFPALGGRRNTTKH